jgi:hypothetical protein
MKIHFFIEDTHLHFQMHQQSLVVVLQIEEFEKSDDFIGAISQVTDTTESGLPLFQNVQLVYTLQCTCMSCHISNYLFSKNLF